MGKSEDLLILNMRQITEITAVWRGEVVSVLIEIMSF